MDNKDIKNRGKILIAILSIFSIILLGLLTIEFVEYKKIEDINYNGFLTMIENEEVDKANITFTSEKFEFVDKNGQKYVTDNPKSEDFKEFMLKNNIEVKVSNIGAYVKMAFNMLGTIITIAVLIFFVKKVGGGLFEKQDLLVSTVPNVNFDNIAGNEESKDDMKFLVNFLKEPKKYNEMGAKLPKGVVLYGPPGTGKTLTAKAIAGEAGVPFFSVSGSDFIEMYAGLGAKRVRDLFKDAKEKAPCIVFIDEIDAIGTSRGGHNNGEKDQTINALLAELDGFNTKEPIITIVATNRVDDLDRALIRPGRFDKHIAINLPDNKDRLSILKVHSKGKKLNENVDLKALSKITIGFSGAALEALMNESAIIAVNEGHKTINSEHINEAYFKMITGGHKKKNRGSNKEELELIAYHEAGHALSVKLLTDNDVPKVTIIPSTSGMGGATFNIPKKTGLITKNELLNNVKVLYAGRAAEFILKQDEGEITTGASQDIKQATQYIEDYFAIYGMSELGMLAINDRKFYDKEAMELSKELYKSVLQLLEDNKNNLKKIADELIEKETINGKDLDRILSMGDKTDE